MTKEPYVLSIPDMHGRYFLMPMLDGFTNVFQVPGKRDDRHGRAKISRSAARVGKEPSPPASRTTRRRPGSSGSSGASIAPARRKTMPPSTPMQAQLSLVPLSAYGKPYTPPAGSVDPSFKRKGGVREQVESLYFGRVSRPARRSAQDESARTAARCGDRRRDEAARPHAGPELGRERAFARGCVGL